MSIKAVIFDFGGVLVRTIHQNGREKWEKRLGLTPGELSSQVFESQIALEASLGKHPEHAIWDYLAQLHHLAPEQAAELERDFWAGDQLDDRLVSFLKGLRGKYKTAILSNAWSNARLSFSQKFKLDQAVDLIIISAEEGLAKPDAAIYHLALKRLDVRPEEAIFVDDFPQNIAAAQALGIQAIQFMDTDQVIRGINQLLSEEA